MCIRDRSLRHISRKHDDYRIVSDCEELVLARMDVRLIIQVLVNLIDNAIKYSPGVPSIVISARERKDGRRTVMVKDSGVGIEKDCQRFVFDKFYRVPQGDLHNVKGYGLGLFYVKGMMEKMGGSVSLRSDPGSGSVFILVFNG